MPNADKCSVFVNMFRKAHTHRPSMWIETIFHLSVYTLANANCAIASKQSANTYKFYMRWSWKNIESKKKKKKKREREKITFAKVKTRTQIHLHSVNICTSIFFFLLALLLDWQNRLSVSRSNLTKKKNWYTISIVRIFGAEVLHFFLPIWCTSCKFSQPNVLNFHLNIFRIFFFFFFYIYIGTFRFEEFSLLYAFTVGWTNVLILMNALLTQLNDWIRIYLLRHSTGTRKRRETERGIKTRRRQIDLDWRDLTMPMM